MDTTFWLLFWMTMIFNVMLFVSGIYVMVRVCKIAKMVFPIAVVACLLLYSLCSTLGFCSLTWLFKYFAGEITCTDLVATLCKENALIAHMKGFAVTESLGSAAESSGLWLFSFKYFESSILLPFIVENNLPPKWLATSLKITQWIILALNCYFAISTEVTLYKLAYEIYISANSTDRY